MKTRAQWGICFHILSFSCWWRIQNLTPFWSEGSKLKENRHNITYPYNSFRLPMFPSPNTATDRFLVEYIFSTFMDSLLETVLSKLFRIVHNFLGNKSLKYCIWSTKLLREHGCDWSTQLDLRQPNINVLVVYCTWTQMSTLVPVSIIMLLTFLLIQQKSWSIIKTLKSLLNSASIMNILWWIFKVIV